MTALEQASYADARQLLLDLGRGCRPRTNRPADSLLEAFEEVLTVHRLKVPARLRKMLMSSNPSESIFSLARG